MLEFQTAAFLNIFEEDGLLIIARGLGEEILVENLFEVYCDPGNLVLVVGSSVKDEEYYTARMSSGEREPKRVTSEFNASERTNVYLEGGVLFVTSRILVVDFLKSIVPAENVTGIIVLNAHKVLDSSIEAFIIRLYREKNKKGFIKGISSNPDAFTRGFCRVENVMKNLFVRKLFLWPRFQATVQSSLETHKPQGIEIQVRLTEPMMDIHSALLELIVGCIRDLRKNNSALDLDEITADNAISKAFDKVIKFQLEPIWHQLSNNTRRLINDLKELRSLITTLTQYDCVTFYKMIQSLSTPESAMRNPGWIFLPAFNVVFERAKERVYGKAKRNKNGIEQPKITTTEADLLLEKSPKWDALEQVFKEILEEMKKSKLPSSACYVLIAAHDIRTCDQIKEVLCNGSRKPLMDLFNKYINTGEVAGKSNNKKRQKKKEPEVESGVLTLTQILRSSSEESGEVKETASSDFELKVLIEPLTGAGGHHQLQKCLLDVKPAYIVMYDIDVAFVRQVEVFKATYPEIPLYLHFLMYENSAEEQRYLNLLRREKQAFEMLIRQKGEMVIPEEREGKGDDDLRGDFRKANETVNPLSGSSTRQGGGAKTGDQHNLERPKVIVDMREFRSELPSLIHRRGIDIEPVTLEVGDYILTPDICVERKSLTDLIGSLNSGRLYSQATAMCRFYKNPVLLIEFDTGKPFILRGKFEVSKEVVTTDYVSKLLLLTLHFPKLKVLWCSSPYATAEIFEELKTGKDQPNVVEAMKITELVTNELGIDSNVEKYNSASKDFLMLLPGVDSKNSRLLMNHCGSLADLSESWSEERLNQLLKHPSNAKSLWKGLHDPLQQLGEPSNATKFKSKTRGKPKWKRTGYN